MTEQPAQDWLAAGRVGRPHGLDGSFHVTRPAGALLRAGSPVLVGDLRTRVVRRAGTDQRPIVRVAGFDDREAAASLRGSELRVPREVAPALGPDEWWAADLEGCRVTAGTRTVGTVTALIALPSCEALEVARAGGGEALLVPLVRDAVTEVDVDGRRIEVDLRFLGER